MAKTVSRSSFKSNSLVEEQIAKPAKDEKEMGYLEHLEEFRWHLIRAVSAVGIATLIAFSFPHIVFHQIILGPSRVNFWTYSFFCYVSKVFNSNALCIDKINFIIQSRTPGGQLLMHLSSSLVVGLVVAFPYVFWELWKFVRPALYADEQKVTIGATFFVSALFLSGILFGYFILAPLSINFLANYQIDTSISNQFDITSYVSTLTTLVLGCGLLFQLPMVVFFLVNAGVLTANFMRTYRRHAIVVILIIAAIVTPPDIFSQIIVSIPLYFLYEMSINIALKVEKRKAKEQETAAIKPENTVEK